MDNKQLPTHIGIILDGNRRWARKKGMIPTDGHKVGAENVRKIAKYANKIGLKYLTVYAFSTENWKRAETEVSLLMGLLKKHLEDFLNTLDDNNIKIQILGDITKLNPKLQENISKTIERTKNNTGLTFNIAFNYGGRDEIVHAVKKIAKKIIENKLSIDDITEKLISDNLYTKGIPDPDLIIRTSGEIRTSGFLTWQSTYSELYFIDKCWPDFSEEDLDKAIEEYQRRNRRFGGA